jgi:hypothetical protein
MTDLQSFMQPTNTVELVEKISDQDKITLDAIKMKRELAIANARAAVAQSESADMSYNNVVLQLAIKYKLNDGDMIEDDGKIKRK